MHLKISAQSFCWLRCFQFCLVQNRFFLYTVRKLHNLFILVMSIEWTIKMVCSGRWLNWHGFELNMITNARWLIEHTCKMSIHWIIDIEWDHEHNSINISIRNKRWTNSEKIESNLIKVHDAMAIILCDVNQSNVSISVWCDFFFVYLCQISCARFSLAFNWIDLFEFYSFMLAFIHNHLCSWKKNNRKKFDQIKTLRLILLVAVNENIEISQKLDSVHQNNSGKQTVDFLAPVCVIGDRSVLGSLLWKFTRNDRQAYFQFIFCINCDLKMFDYFNVHWKIPIQNAE